MSQQSRQVSEDSLAMIAAGLMLAVSLCCTALGGTGGGAAETAASAWQNPLSALLKLPKSWESNPFAEVSGWLPGVVGSQLLLGAALMVGMLICRVRTGEFWLPFHKVFVLSMLAYVLAEQKVVKYYGLEYALWALLIGLLISNTVGVSGRLRPAVRTELYMKTGLVLLGAEVLFGKLLALGLPGICVSWVVTPVVLIVTFWFGQRVLKIESAALNMVISADMSVCGVSAAIATAAACRAKKEELTAAVGISLAFTVPVSYTHLTLPTKA